MYGETKNQLAQGEVTNQVTVLELHEFLDTLVLVHGVIVGDYTLSVDGSLQSRLMFLSYFGSGKNIIGILYTPQQSIETLLWRTSG